MAKSDTWPGGAAMASLNAVDSAGSCDSVISGNSACSDDSMEHLSPEERACLMFLEETIEAMEMMEDSGLSNDELEFGLKLKSNNPATVNGISSSSHKSDKSLSCSAADPGITPTLQQTPESTPAPAVTSKEVKTADLEVQSSPSVSRSASDVAPHTPLNPTNASRVSWDLRNPEVASEVDLSIIPPPLDFMDEPELPPEELNEIPPPAEPFPEPDAPPPADSQQSEPKVPTENPSLDSEVDGPSCSPPPTAEDSIPLNPYLEVPEHRAPPAVAPKPKSIPANIVLRSHKPTGSEGHSATNRDVVMDPQKVRMEALRKLGLLKQEEAPPPAFARGGSLKTRTPQEAPISPVGSGNPPLKSALYSHVHSQPAASAPDVLPAPAAFSDVDGFPPPPPPDNPAPTVSGALPAPVKQYTTQKIARSATFEQCSVGPSTDAAGQGDATQSPKELRKMRPRPASMGGGDPAHFLKQQPPAQRHAPNVPRESGKLPRSQGISVLICPRPENAEDRREALKKLGLLRY